MEKKSGYQDNKLSYARYAKTVKGRLARSKSAIRTHARILVRLGVEKTEIESLLKGVLS